MTSDVGMPSATGIPLHHPLTVMDRSTVFEMLPMPAFIKDTDLVYTHANTAFCELVGLDSAAVIGRTVADVSPLDAEWHRSTDLKVLEQGGTSSFDLNIRLVGRAAMRVELIKIRLDDADRVPVGVLGVLIDRTRLRDAEQNLLESQALHRLVVETMSDAIFLLDEDLRFTFVAPNVMTIFGVDAAEAMASGSLCDLLACDTCELQSLSRDEVTRNLERTIVQPDGTRRHVLIDAKPIEIGASRWLITCHDITERVDNLARMKTSMVKTVQALCTTVEQRDPYVTGHQDRVADLAVAIAREIGLDDDRIEGLRLASIVHDIGKINVPIQILSKPGKLTQPEFEIIKSHAEVGYEILKDIDFPWPVARMVREHHEAMDGSGYPLGLTGDQLLLESRILSVADVLEAVTSHRPYRASLGLDKGLEILSEMRGRKLDPAVVDVCLELIRSRKVAVPGWTTDEGSSPTR